MNPYHQEQIEAFAMVLKHLKKSPSQRQDLLVLLDRLEAHFINAGYQSPLMYLHNSPGLLRVKQKAGLIK